MAIPQFVTSGPKTEWDGGMPITNTVSWPAHQIGDIGILITESTAVVGVGLSPSQGFVELPNSPQVSSAPTATVLRAYWCRATSTSMPAPTLATPTNHVFAVILTFRGCLPFGNPFDVTSGDHADSDTTTVSIPGGTTTLNDCLIVAIATRGNDATGMHFSGWPTTPLYTEQYDDGTAKGNGGGFGVATAGQATAGVYAAIGATLSVASGQARMSLALRSLPAHHGLHYGLYYDVTGWDPYNASNNLVGDGVTDNRAALRALVNYALGNGGGTIFFPAGVYHFAIGGAGDRNILNLIGNSSAIVDLNLRFLGEGRASTLSWGGDAGAVDAHFFNLADGVRNFEIANLRMALNGALTNPESHKLHHLVSIAGGLNGNNEYFRFINVDFGVCPGDCINLRGGISSGAIVSASPGIPATTAPGDLVLTLGQPLMPQRLTLTFPEFSTPTGTSNPTINVTGGNTYHRTTGSFATDGFATGQNIVCSGFTDPANNGAKVVSSVSGADLVVSGGLVNESGTGNEKIVCPWDGGGFTITGTDPRDNVLVETFDAASGDTRVGRSYFKTVTLVHKDGAAGTATSGLLATVGVACEVRQVLIQGCRFNGFDYVTNAPGYGVRSAVGAQRLSSHIMIVNNYMTGCDDQLIDFEPTGNGEIGPWFIRGNTIICDTPKSGSQRGVLAATLTGNGNSLAAGPILNEYSVFADNYVEGRILGGKWHRVRILRNTLIDTGNTTQAAGMIGSSGTNNDVEIRDNVIVCLPTTLGKAISLPTDDPYQPDGLRVEGNTIFWYDNANDDAAINVQGTFVTVRGNQLRFLSSGSTVINGIVVGPPLATTGGGRYSICDNVIHGGAGSGTLQTGLVFTPGAGQNTTLLIARNHGTGCRTGLSFSLGSAAGLSMVSENYFLDATTPIDSSDTYIVSGNSGGWATYRGSGPDPNAISILDNVELGSLYSGGNGELWKKCAAGAAGWMILDLSLYASGSITLPTGRFVLMAQHLVLTTTQRASLKGTSRLSIKT